MQTAEFVEWVMHQSRRPLKAQIREYIVAKGLRPSTHEIRSLTNTIYVKLRRGAALPIEYRPNQRAPRDDRPIDVSDSHDLQVISDAIQHNGFALDGTTESLKQIQTTHANALVGQQRAVGSLVKNFTTELAIKDVKLANEQELSRRDRQTADDLRASLDDARRDKAFLQAMIVRKPGDSNLV